MNGRRNGTPVPVSDYRGTSCPARRRGLQVGAQRTGTVTVFDTLEPVPRNGDTRSPRTGELCSYQWSVSNQWFFWVQMKPREISKTTPETQLLKTRPGSLEVTAASQKPGTLTGVEAEGVTGGRGESCREQDESVTMAKRHRLRCDLTLERPPCIYLGRHSK